MNRARFFIECFRRRLLSAIVAIIVLGTVAFEPVWSQDPYQVEGADKEKILRQVSQEWFQVGIEQYSRCLYKEAEQSFLKAQEHQEYLTTEEREQIQSALEDTHIAVFERRRISETLLTVGDLIDRGELLRAKAYLEGFKDSRFLTESERALVTDRLKNIESQLNERNKEATELYNRSVELYNNGELEKAREGFLKVAQSGLSVVQEGRSAEDYLVRIDNILVKRARIPTAAEPRPSGKKQDLIDWTAGKELPGVEIEVVEVAGPAVVKKARQAAGTEVKVVEPKITEEANSYVIKRRKNILLSYTKAVVNDAVGKVESYISKGDFDNAQKAVERAEWIIYQNWAYLGDELFKQYNNNLKLLTEKIVKEQSKEVQ
ncbi:MAG: hypothetical protein ACYS0I_10940 [Planctomycetota bacterium]